jgi:hypothetical protein
VTDDRIDGAPKVPRRHRRALIAVSIAVVVLVVAAASAFAYTRRTGFCASSCHEMRPFARSLCLSAHRGLACAPCHQDPGVRNTLAAEWKGIVSVARHVGGAKTVEIEGIDATKVPSRRCLVCHPWHKLQRPVKLGTAQFDHLSHARVDCVTCHLRTAHPGAAGAVVDPPATMLAASTVTWGARDLGTACSATRRRTRVGASVRSAMV